MAEARRLKVGCPTRRRKVFLLNLFIVLRTFFYLIVLVAWRLAVCQVGISGGVLLVQWSSALVLRPPCPAPALVLRAPLSCPSHASGTHLERNTPGDHVTPREGCFCLMILYNWIIFLFHDFVFVSTLCPKCTH